MPVEFMMALLIEAYKSYGLLGLHETFSKLLSLSIYANSLLFGNLIDKTIFIVLGLIQ